MSQTFCPLTSISASEAVRADAVCKLYSWMFSTTRRSSARTEWRFRKKKIEMPKEAGQSLRIFARSFLPT
jgi:hypothetical protein